MAIVLGYRDHVQQANDLVAGIRLIRAVIYSVSCRELQAPFHRPM